MRNPLRSLICVRYMSSLPPMFVRRYPTSMSIGVCASAAAATTSSGRESQRASVRVFIGFLSYLNNCGERLEPWMAT